MAARDAVAPTEMTQGSVRPPGWVRLLLGGVMILAGLAVLADVAFASLVSASFVGAAAIAVGAFEIAHAVWTKERGALKWHVLLGFLYVAVGGALVGGAGLADVVVAPGIARSARAGSLLLTYGLGLLLMLSGAVRLLLVLSRWRESGWMMLSAGLFGIVAGLIVLAEFPKTGFWIFGLLLGIDLVVHGAAWLGRAVTLRARAT